MPYSLLAAWTGFAIQGGDTWGWLLALVVGGWIGIRWWSAQIAQQFEREQPREHEVASKSEARVDWKLGGLVKLLLLLFLLACVTLVLLL
jgi:hypothetical protein